MQMLKVPSAATSTPTDVSPKIAAVPELKISVDSPESVAPSQTSACDHVDRECFSGGPLRPDGESHSPSLAGGAPSDATGADGGSCRRFRQGYEGEKVRGRDPVRRGLG